MRRFPCPTGARRRRAAALRVRPGGGAASVDSVRDLRRRPQLTGRHGPGSVGSGGAVRRAAGRADPGDPQRRAAGHQLPEPDVVDRDWRRARPARPGVPERLRAHGPVLRELHPQRRRRHGRGALPPVGRQPAGRRSELALRPAVAGAARHGHGQRLRRLRVDAAARHLPAVQQSQRRQDRVRRRTATCTSAWATAATAATRRTRRSGPARCSARCCASTSACPTATRAATGFPPTTRSSAVRAGGGDARRDLVVRPAQPVALHLRSRPGSAAPARC